MIELLLVIAVIVALAVTVFVALNPAARLASARNARRTSDVDTLLTATHEYIIDHTGSFPFTPTTTDEMIGTAATSSAVSTGGCNVPAASAEFNASSVYAAYLASAPMDPLSGTATSTGYAINIASSTGIVTVKACLAENSSTIQESR